VSGSATLALFRTEVRLHARHRVAAGVAALTAIWLVAIWFLPAHFRRDAVAWALFLDVATVGFFFAPALMLVERANGVTTALRLTRMSPRLALGVRMAGLAGLGLAAALAFTLGTGMGWAPVVLVGATLMAVLTSLLALVMVGRDETLTGYLPRMPLVGVPLFVPALVYGVGLADHPLLWLSPATGGLELLFGRWSPGAALWILVTCVALWIRAERVVLDVRPRRPRPGSPAGQSPRSPLAPAGHGRLAAIRSFARVDRRTLLSDGTIAMLALGIPLLAVLIRLATGPGLEWAEGRFGVDLSPHLPLAWALVLVAHAPVMAGAIVGMLFLEDRDAGLLPVIATTRSGLGALIGYRLLAAAVLTAVALAVSLPLAGATHATGIPGVLITALVAAAVSTVPATLLASLVGDRVAGVALMKAIGLPLYLPLAWWFVDHPAAWLFAVIPTAWAVQAFWAESLGGALWFAAGGVACSAVWVAAALPMLRRSVVG
jgi:fluoroquinolone transport system permease protein